MGASVGAREVVTEHDEDDRERQIVVVDRPLLGPLGVGRVGGSPRLVHQIDGRPLARAQRDLQRGLRRKRMVVDQVLALRRQSPERFTYLFRPSLGYEHIINLNLANPILADVRVRHALLLAIDRNAINTKLFEGLQPVAATWVNPRLVEDTLGEGSFQELGEKTKWRENAKT